MISVAHWGRLEEGALFAWSRRLEAGSCATTSVVWDPTAVPVPSLAAVAGVSVGQWHACAFDADGARKG